MRGVSNIISLPVTSVTNTTHKSTSSVRKNSRKTSNNQTKVEAEDTKKLEQEQASEIERKRIYKILLKQEKANVDRYGKLLLDTKVNFKGVSNSTIVGKQSNTSKRKYNIKRLRDVKQVMMQGGMQSECQPILDLLSKCNNIDTTGLIEASILLMYDLYRSHGIMDISVSITHFVKHVFKTNVIDIIQCALNFFSKHIEPYLLQMQAGKDTTAGFESNVDSMLGMFRHFDSIKTSVVYKKVKQLILYLWTIFLDLVPSDASSMSRYESFERKFNLSRVNMDVSSILDIVHSLLFLLKQGFQMIKSGSMLTFWHHEDSYKKWANDVSNLDVDIANLNHPDLTKQVSIQDVIRNIEKLIDEGEEMLKVLTKYTKGVVNSDLVRLRIELTKQQTSLLAMTTRPAPLSLLVHSSPNCGKTSFLDILQSFFADVEGLTMTADSKYVRNFQDEYWSNFKSCMWCIVFDDIGYENINKITSIREASQNEIIQVNNNTAFIVNMADLKDKGNVVCMPKLVMATTNCRDLNAKHLYNDALAALRRFPYVISLTVKEEYATTHGGLDPDLVHIGEDVLDVWNIVVSTPFRPKVQASESNSTKQDIQWKEIATFTDMPSFLKYYKTLILAHDEVQRKVMSHSSKMRDSQFCTTCCRLRCNCGLQAGEITEIEICTACLNTRAGCECSKCMECLKSVHTCKCRGKIHVENLWFMRRLFSTARRRRNITIPRRARSSAIEDDHTPRHSEPNNEPREIPETVRQKFERAQFFALESLAQQFCKAISWQLYGLQIWNLLSWPLWIMWGAGCWPFIYIIYHTGIMCVWFLTVLSPFVFIEQCFLPIYQRLPWTVRFRVYKWIGSNVMLRFYGKHFAVIDTLVKALAFCGTSYAAYKFFNKRSEPEEEVDVQGGFSSKQDNINPYWNPVTPSTSSCFGECVTSWKSLPEEQVIDLVSQSVVRIRSVGAHRRVGCGLYIGGQVVVTNLHLFKDLVNFDVTFADKSSNATKTTIRCKVNPDTDIYIIQKKDLMFIRFRNLPNRRNLTGLLATTYIKDLNCLGLMIKRTNEGCINLYKRNRMRWSGEKLCFDDYSQLMYDTMFYSYQNDETIDGDCGSTYLAFSPKGPVIVAIHQHKSTIAFGASLLQKDANEALEALRSKTSGGNLIRETLPFSILDWSKNSNLRLIENSDAYVFGSTPKRFPSKSKVEKTIIHEDIKEFGIEDKYSAPLMIGRQVWINQITPIVSKENNLDLVLLDKAKCLYYNEVTNNLDVNIYSETCPLSIHESINGKIGNKFIRSINKHTSAGFPLNKCKLNFMEVLDDDTMVVDEKILKDVEAIIDIYNKDSRAMIVYMGSLKDEVVTLKKRNEFKTRMFTGSPFAFTLVFRKYYLPLVAIIQENCEIFESYPGTNPMGPDWEELYNYIVQFGEDRICAGDYQAFDKNMCAAVILSAFDILIDIARLFNYTDDDIRIMKALAYDVAFPIIAADGDLFMANGFNPSGHPLTVIINCLVNCLYLRMCFIHYNPLKRSFKKHVALATYGDDNIFGVSPECIFDHTKVAEFLAQQGIVYTMADKTAKSVPFINIKDATFLKRSFVFDRELQHITAPLELDSIYRSLLYTIPSGAICAEAQMIQKIESALMELFFYGKDKYDKSKTWLEALIVKHDMQDFQEREFLEYEELAQRFLETFGENYIIVDDMVQLQGGWYKPTTVKPFDITYMRSDEYRSQLCQVCHQEGCYYRHRPNNFTIKCPRCWRCRSRVIVIDDTFFYGCIYCETEEEICCDECGGPSATCHREGPYHNKFLCYWCAFKVLIRGGPHTYDVAWMEAGNVAIRER
jgi:hypothetical protein